MKSMTRMMFLALAVTLGVAAVVLTTAGLSTAATTSTVVDLAVDVKAPEHVAMDADYEINVSYVNVGLAPAPDNRVTVELPLGTIYVTATDASGDPRPPDVVEGNRLSWDPAPLPGDSVWKHIFVTVHTDPALEEGALLTASVSITTTAAEPNTGNNEASVVSVVCAMAGSVKQVQARNVLPGDVLTYTIHMNMNQPGGGMNGRWVTLTDTLPPSHQARFLGWTGTVTGAQLEGQMLRWQGRMQAGDVHTLQYRLGVEGAITPGTPITNVAMLGWAGRQLRLGPVTSVVTLPHGMLGLGPHQGGQVRHAYGVTLTVPPGAVTDTTRFRLGPLFTATGPITPPGGLLFANRAFEINAYRFGESVRQFSRPLTITLGYSDTDVAGLKRESLQLWTRSGPEGPWAVLGEPARVMSGALVYTTSHLSQFALFGEGEYKVYMPIVAH